MKKKNKLLAILSLVMVCMLTTVTVHAAVAYGSWSVLGRPIGSTLASYQGRSTIVTGTNYARGNTQIKTSKQVGAGEIGGIARLYNSSGSLVLGTGARYNTSATSEFWVETSVYNKGGVYYSQGILYQWDGGSNSSHSLSKTPNMNARSAEVEYEIKENENGETYGSALGQEKDPDLIAAIGTNGEEGYVKASDITPPADMSLEEALAYTSEAVTVPLYMSDGETEIGEFILEEPTCGYDLSETN